MGILRVVKGVRKHQKITGGTGPRMKQVLQKIQGQTLIHKRQIRKKQRTRKMSIIRDGVRILVHWRLDLTNKRKVVSSVRSINRRLMKNTISPTILCLQYLVSPTSWTHTQPHYPNSLRFFKPRFPSHVGRPALDPPSLTHYPRQPWLD